ncbi:MAG: hypothetical protein EKK57_04800 [Proteobacteria bacterium]|nr:MAG: hypothetical protein EKK57_04800 [Pseudomonadota bacterium]
MITSLEQIIEVFSHTYNDSAVQICDNQLYFRFVGNKALEIMELMTNDVVGKKLVDINCPIQHLANKLYKLNVEVLNGKLSKAVYTICFKQKQNLIIAKNEAMPIMLNDKISGLFIKTNFIDSIFNFDLGILSNKFKNTSAAIINDSHSNNFIFTGTEELITFLIVIGKIDKEIVEILKSIGIFFSRSGISKLITRKLFPKLGVKTRNQFITQIFYRGLMNKLPCLLIENNTLFNLVFN